MKPSVLSRHARPIVLSSLILVCCIIAAISLYASAAEKDVLTNDTLTDISSAVSTASETVSPTSVADQEVGVTLEELVPAPEENTVTVNDAPISQDNAQEKSAANEPTARAVPTPVPTDIKNIAPKKAEEPSTATDTIGSVEDAYIAMLTVRGPAGAAHYAVDVDIGATVQDLMNAAKAKGFSFKTKNFSGLGAYVTTINGVTEDAEANMYWTYSVNNKKATSGIGSKTLKQGDSVQWNYEKSY